MGLGSSEIEPPLVAAGDMDEEIGIGLLMGRFAAIALDVGHGTADH